MSTWFAQTFLASKVSLQSTGHWFTTSLAVTLKELSPLQKLYSLLFSSENEIHVEVHDKNVLRFGHNPYAEREREDDIEPGIFLRAERVSSFRNRNLRMPDNANMEAPIKATYNDGVLEIIIPKKTVEEGAPPAMKSIAVD